MGFFKFFFYSRAVFNDSAAVRWVHDVQYNSSNNEKFTSAIVRVSRGGRKKNKNIETILGLDFSLIKKNRGISKQISRRRYTYAKKVFWWPQDFTGDCVLGTRGKKNNTKKKNPRVPRRRDVSYCYYNIFNFFISRVFRESIRAVLDTSRSSFFFF